MKYRIESRNGRIILHIDGEYDYQEMIACFADLAEKVSQGVYHTLVFDARALTGDASAVERFKLAQYFEGRIFTLNIVILINDEHNPNVRHFSIALNNQGYWIRKISDEKTARRFLE